MSPVAPLISQFRRAGLDLRVAARPLIRVGNEEIVQLDIARKPQQFLLWPGAPTNALSVQGIDRQRQQLVLFVKEPARAFEVEVTERLISGRPVIRPSRRRGWVWVREVTPAAQRHLLCGMDEQHYFIAQLARGVSTVREAHQVLFSEEAGKHASSNREKLLRQGEWFFVRASAAEVASLEAALHTTVFPRRDVAVHDGTSAFRRGRPHLVTELAQVLPSERGSGAVYVRGKVRHPDHRVLDLLQWHRVFGNREASAPPGVKWVD